MRIGDTVISLTRALQTGTPITWNQGHTNLHGIYIAWCYTEVRATRIPIGPCKFSPSHDMCLQEVPGAACQIAFSPLRVIRSYNTSVATGDGNAPPGPSYCHLIPTLWTCIHLFLTNILIDFILNITCLYTKIHISESQGHTIVYSFTFCVVFLTHSGSMPCTRYGRACFRSDCISYMHPRDAWLFIFIVIWQQSANPSHWIEKYGPTMDLFYYGRVNLARHNIFISL